MPETTAKSARKPPRKVSYQHAGNGLTNPSGSYPVIHFHQQLGFDDLCQRQLGLQRDPNATYSLTDAVFMTLTGLIARASSLLKVAVVWSDQ
jgi:hypothetical protein